MRINLGVLGILGIIFVILKLVGTINWSWFWVLSPFIIYTSLALIGWTIAGITLLIVWIALNRK